MGKWKAFKAKAFHAYEKVSGHFSSFVSGFWDLLKKKTLEAMVLATITLTIGLYIDDLKAYIQDKKENPEVEYQFFGKVSSLDSCDAFPVSKAVISISGLPIEAVADGKGFYTISFKLKKNVNRVKVIANSPDYHQSDEIWQDVHPKLEKYNLDFQLRDTQSQSYSSTD
ncbi:MAG TPA: hypothetical protein PKE06_15300 [Flavilitoribacter sp.]|nr:hypothetical protein [Flavilitoribacter sp.]HMQ88463.1 hypothetical protein [Flavilitoribacter sp.]